MTQMPSSFRDPSGNIYMHNGDIYRTITNYYQHHYEMLMSSGLYDELIKNEWLVPHIECNVDNIDCWKVIKPQIIENISYPYEWSFSQLKDAALLTLNIMNKALAYNMCLKDASAFNVLFQNNKPIFIDTLSFEQYNRGAPWIAYGQFCRHFLAPLLLMSYTDVRLLNLFTRYIDGIPIDLASKLLPKTTRLKPGIFFHIHLHANMINKQSNSNVETKSNTKNEISDNTIHALIDSLMNLVQNIKTPDIKTEWSDYYSDTNYTNTAFESKINIVDKYISMIKPEKVLDLGANDGTFSRIAAKYAETVVSVDYDPIAADINYNKLRKDNINNINTVLLDLNNPTPGIGWNNQERMSFKERFQTDMVLVLGLMHHLCISNNIPFEYLAKFISELGEYAIVEYIPKSDSNVQRLLKTRRDIFDKYTQNNFEISLKEYFYIIECNEINNSKRKLYLLKK